MRIITKLRILNGEPCLNNLCNGLGQSRIYKCVEKCIIIEENKIMGTKLTRRCNEMI